jgi:hypothetical protein
MSEFSGKSKVNSVDGFAVNPGTDVVISNNDKNSTDLVSAYDLNTDTETRVASPEFVNEGIDPNEALPGVRKGIKTDDGQPETIEEGEEVVEARAKAVAASDDTAVSEVPEGSIKDVLAWVDGDPAKAKLALEAEEKGEKRSTLISKLNEVK